MYAIVAADRNWGIGRDGDQLCYIPADLKRFQALTTGHAVVLGRRTLSTFPGGRPLKGRRNLILSRNPDFAPEGAEVYPDLDSLLAQAPEDSCVIGGASVYAALAERGFFPVEELSTHYANGSRLSGHVSHKGVPGVEFSTGSLGHGLSVAAGMALGGKKDNADWRVYCVLGDGECDEGSVWEAALQAHQYKLDNLVAIIDHNRMQSLDFCENTLALEPFGDKWRAFGWNVIETDGNDVDAVEKALRQAQENRGSGRPTVVIAVTTKGKGVSFMENDILWHYRTPQGEEYDAALAELEAQRP